MKNKDPAFLKGWLAYNFIGWALGGLIVVALLQQLPVFNYYPSLRQTLSERALGNALGSVMLWLPLAASVATWQWLCLKRRKVPGLAWILGTTLAWVLPPVILPVVLDGLGIRNFQSWTTGGAAAQFIMMVLAVASVQAVVLRGSRSSSGLLIVAYLLGSFLLAFLALLTWGIGFNLGKSLVPFFLSHGEIGAEIVGNRDTLLLAFVYLLAPVWATLALGLPTGLILRRHLRRQEPG